MFKAPAHLKTFILTSVDMLLILGLLGADKCRVFGPGGEGHPGVIQDLDAREANSVLSLRSRLSLKSNNICTNVCFPYVTSVIFWMSKHRTSYFTSLQSGVLPVHLGCW